MFLNPNIRIGCSGWQYTHWRGDFYPAELPQARWLAYYAQRFDTVEINSTFYRLPEAETFARWADRAPRGFVYLRFTPTSTTTPAGTRRATPRACARR
jgi:uncharacterized protein YecE (DUF72 family)